MLLPFAAALLLAFGFGSNFGLAVLAVIVLVVGGVLLWRPGEIPILLYAFAFQWVQASISIFAANAKNFHINDITYFVADIEMATFLSLIALLTLAIGIRLAAGPPDPRARIAAQLDLQRVPQATWLKLYGVALAVSFMASLAARYIPGLSQPLLALANFKWAFFTVLTMSTFARPDANKTIWLMVFLGEFLLSIGEFFSTFKTVFIFSFLGILASGVRVSFSRRLTAGLLAGLAIVLGLAWTAIKVDYRSYISDGAAAQVVTVSYGERLGKLVDLVAELGAGQLADAGEAVIDRVGYVSFFGAAINYVPDHAPYERGALWFDALSRPFMPRILFPNKAVIDDSALTNKYTGLGVAGARTGTSISIGYVAESYIDFGPYGMMGAIFGLGLVIGWIYRWFTRDKLYKGVFGLGVASAVMFSVSTLETALAKVVGALTVSVLVAWLFRTVALSELRRQLRF